MNIRSFIYSFSISLSVRLKKKKTRKNIYSLVILKLGINIYEGNVSVSQVLKL